MRKTATLFAALLLCGIMNLNALANLSIARIITTAAVITDLQQSPQPVNQSVAEKNIEANRNRLESTIAIEDIDSSSINSQHILTLDASKIIALTTAPFATGLEKEQNPFFLNFISDEGILFGTTPVITAMTATTCSGVTFTVTPVNGTDGTVPAGTTYSWSAPTVTGAVTGGASGSNATNISGTLINPTNTTQTATYTVTPVNGGNTGNTFTVTVTISPIASINAMTSTICSGVAFSVSPTQGANGTVPSGTTYTWTTPTGTGFSGGVSQTTAVNSITGNLTNNTNVAVTATYQITPTSGSCVGSVFTVTVTVSPVSSITAMTATTCSGVLVSGTPVNGINGTVPSGTTYTWGAPSVTGGLTGGGFPG